MKKLGNSIVVFMIITVLFGCENNESICNGYLHDPPERNNKKVTIDQGLWGDVWFWEGDFFPRCMTGTIKGVEREIRIHDLTNLDSVTIAFPYTPFYEEIKTDIVAIVHSDSDGFFEVELPPGQYSIFVVEDSLFYSNGFDTYGNISPFTVEENEVTEIRFDIRYLAVS